MCSSPRVVLLVLLMLSALSGCTRDGGQTGDEGAPHDSGVSGDFFEQLRRRSSISNYQPASSLRALAMASDVIIVGRARRVERGRVFVSTSLDGSNRSEIGTVVVHFEVLQTLKGNPGDTLYLEFIVGDAEAPLPSSLDDSRVLIFAKAAFEGPQTTGGTIEHVGRGLPQNATLRTLTTPQGFAMETVNGVEQTFEPMDGLLQASSFDELIAAVIEALTPIDVPHDDDDAAIDGGADAAVALDATVDGGTVDDADAGTLITFLQPTVFDLPINSVRYAVSGYDATRGLCISVIWNIGAFDVTRFCAIEDASSYAVVQAATAPGCWDYGGDTQLVALDGCADFGDLTDPADDTIDVTADLQGDLFTGGVRFVFP